MFVCDQFHVFNITNSFFSLQEGKTTIHKFVTKHEERASCIQYTKSFSSF